MRLIRTIIATGLPLCGAGYLLLRFAPAPVELAQRLRAPGCWVAQVGTNAAVASLAGALLWLCALWVVVGLAAVWIGQLPGLAGQLGRTVTRCAVPVAIQRLVAASAGFSLLLGGASAGAVGQPAATPGNPGVPASTLSAPGWPLDQPGRSAPSRPVVATSAGPTHASDSPPTVTVQPGDSLWTIAGAELGPAATDQQIAIAWPYWYRANRPLIGRDPNLLRPGSELSRPATGPPGG